MSVSGSINTKNMMGFLCKTQKTPGSCEPGGGYRGSAGGQLSLRLIHTCVP